MGDIQVSFLEKIPWEKILIWIIFLISIYTLRHFFFIFFMTFIVSYSMRGLVVFLGQKFSFQNSRIAEVSLSIFCFLALLGTLYGVGSYLVPEFVRQGQELTKRISNPSKSPKEKFDELLANTFGRLLFQQKYTDKTSENYRKEFQKFQEEIRNEDEFAKKSERLEKEFALSLIDKVPENIASITRENALQEWILKVKAPLELQTERNKYTTEWEKLYRDQVFQIPGLTPLEKLSPIEREGAVERYVTSLLYSNESKRAELENEFKLDNALKCIQNIKKTQPEEYRSQFEKFYTQEQKQSSEPLPYTFEIFSKLSEAHKTGPAAFKKVFEDIKPGIDTKQSEMVEFEKQERLKLITVWQKGEIAEKLKNQAEEYGIEFMSHIGKYIGEFIPKLLLLPVNLLLILLLSFFITIDIPKLREGINKIKASKLRHMYEEIAPGLISFGKLIGRAFQAQGVIAVANTMLTLIVIRILGVQNEIFLSAVVFICSFIPVLGVVLSSVPIALMAIIQEDGGLLLALSSIGGILIVHFIETSLLNPKIMGNMLHLHPVLVLAILAICEHFFGVWGLLLGVPVVVYIIRFVILEEGIPGVIEHPKRLLEAQLETKTAS
jgi:predicted PurR-regulated permease PerM